MLLHTALPVIPYAYRTAAAAIATPMGVCWTRRLKIKTCQASKCIFSFFLWRCWFDSVETGPPQKNMERRKKLKRKAMQSWGRRDRRREKTQRNTKPSYGYYAAQKFFLAMGFVGVCCVDDERVVHQSLASDHRMFALERLQVRQREKKDS